MKRLSQSPLRDLTQRELLSLKKTAIQAAHASGAILRKSFGKALQIREKRDAGLVTQVDLASEKAALKILLGAFPDFGILAEESDPLISPHPGRWILDPLDGTTNYIHGFPMFCVSIAAEWHNEVVVGVIYHPILDETYVAVRGQGATVNGKPIHVSNTRSLRDSLLSTGFTYRKHDWLDLEMATFTELSQVSRAIRRPGSAALDLAYLARGVFDSFWERNLAPWDMAAGWLLVTEAGGKVTDFSGKKFRVESPEIIASNGHLHAPMLRAIRARRI
jgi:myo-inositol-1(or 4)-monophosphatase